MKYNEIFKLKKLLEDANIPFVIHSEVCGVLERHQIEYPCSEKRVCSVIEGKYTYGAEQDLLEIMGLLTRKEAKHDFVCGYLSAKEVFKRIKKHYKKSRRKERKFKEKFPERKILFVM